MPPKRKISSADIDALIKRVMAAEGVPTAKTPTRAAVAKAAAAPAVAGPKDTSYDDWLKTRPKPGKKGSAKNGPNKRQEESTFQRIMDVLSRGNYASAEAFRRGTAGDDGYDVGAATKGFFSGLSGKSKTHFADVLRQEGNAKGNEGKVGFLLDVFADPLTYTGVGLVAKGGKAIEGSTKVTKAFRAAERAKPDIVQLADLTAKGVKKFSAKRRGVAVPAEAAEEAVSGAAAFRGSVPVAGAVADTTRRAELGAEDSPELIAKINAEIAERTGSKNLPLPNSTNTAPKRPGVVTGSSFGAAVARPPKAAPEFDPNAFEFTAGNVLKTTDERFIQEFPNAVKGLGFTSLGQVRAAARNAGDGSQAATNKRRKAQDVLSKIEGLPQYKEVRNAASREVTNNLAKAKLAASRAAKESAPPATGLKGGVLLADLTKTKAIKEPKAKRVSKKESQAQSAVAVEQILKTTDEAPEVLQAADARVIAGDKQARIDGRDTKSIDNAVDTEFKTMSDPVATAKLAEGGKGWHKDFTPVKQVNLLNTLSDALTVRRGNGVRPSGAARTRTSLRVDPEQFEILKKNYRHAENIMEARHGKLPVSGPDGGAPLRLSAILDQLDVADVNGKNVPTLVAIATRATGVARYDEIYDKALAASALQDTAQAAAPLMAIADTVKSVDGLSPAAATEVLDNAKAAAKEATKATGTSKAGQESTAEIIDGIVKAKKDELFDPLMQIYDKAGKKIGTLQGAKPYVNPKTPVEPLIESVIAADKILGVYVGPFPVAKLNLTKVNGKIRNVAALEKTMKRLDSAADSIMLRLSTSRGIVDDKGTIANRGKALQQGQAIQVNRTSAYVADASKSIDAILKPLDEPQRLDLFAAAKGGEDNPIAARFDSIAKIAAANGIRADEVAQELRALSPKGAEDIPFMPNAANGFDAWKNATISGDLHKHMINYETAVAKAHTKTAVYSDFAQSFGSATPVAGWKKMDQSVHPMVKGLWFRPEDIEHLIAHKRMMEFAAGNPQKQAGPLLQKYDSTLRVWKFLATRINPQYYVRNGIGESYINSLDGVRLRDYNRAFRVMGSRNEVPLGDLNTAFNDISPAAVAFTHGPSKTKVTYEMVWRAYNESGARQVFAVSDNMGTNVAKKPLPGQQAIEAGGDYSETILRMAHFVHRLEKSGLKQWDEAVREAGAHVNRQHGNYGEATQWEQKYARRIIPFYTWQKKVTPILLESALMNPGRTMVYPKLQYAIAQNFGGDPEQMTGTLFPQPDELMPEWMREGAAVPYGISSAGNTIMADPGTPFTDQLKENVNRPAENILGQLTPAIKAPLELTRTDDEAPNGRTFFGGGVPIQDKTDYALGQVPLLSTLTRLTREGPLASEKYGPDEQGINMLAVQNWLFGLRKQENTERRQRGAGIEAQKKARREARERANK